MRLKKLWISQYKNFNNLTVDFDKCQNNAAIFIGNNGVGKSNLIDFICMIFRNLYLGKSTFLYDFELEYFLEEIDQNIKILCNNKKLRVEVNGDNYQVAKIKYENYSILPKNIIGYYSGSTKKLQEILKLDLRNKYNELYMDYISMNEFPIILLTMISSDTADIREFIENYLSINRASLKFNLKNPFNELRENFSSVESLTEKYQVNFSEPMIVYEDYIDLYNLQEQAPFDDLSYDQYVHGYIEPINDFFSITQQTKRIKPIHPLIYAFMQSLKKYAHSSQLSNTKTYFQIIINNINEIPSQNDISTDKFFFLIMRELYNQKLMQDLKITFYKDNIKITHNELSEGEQQFIALKGIVEFMRGSDVLFIFDEPDTYLHPKWQREFVPKISEHAKNTQFIITTHSPQLLSNVASDNIFIIKKSDNKSIITYPPRSVLGRDINSILEETMDVSERNPEIDKMFDEYFKLISDKKFPDAEQMKINILEITKSESRYYEDEPLFAKANAIIQRMKVFGK